MWRSQARVTHRAVAALLVVVAASQAVAQSAFRFDIAAQSLDSALREIGHQTSTNILFDPRLVAGLAAPALSAEVSADEAIQHLLAGTQLRARRTSSDAVVVERTRSDATRVVRASSVSMPPTDAPIRLAQAGEGAAPATSSVEPPSPQEKELTLEEVTVTATRREESVEKVPISIVALSQSELTAGGIKGIADIAAVTPGLQFQVPNGFASSITTISIRGMNTNTGASTVGLYLDDTPIQGRLSPNNLIGNPYPVVFDLNRVEVARGPQGTLFGAGSEAGTVRFITNEPSLNEFSGFSRAETAMTQRGDPSYEIGAAAGGPIIDNQLGFRVSLWDRQDGGYVDRIDPVTGRIVQPDANSDNKSAFKVALAYLVDGIRITPSVYYQSLRSNDGGRFYVRTGGGETFSDPSQGIFNNGRLLPDVLSDSFTLASVKIEDSLPFAQLTSTTSYTHRNADGSLDASAGDGAYGGVPGGYGSPLGPEFPTSDSDASLDLYKSRVHAFTEEVRLASNQPEAFLTWVAGVFYDHRTQQDYQVQYSPLLDPSGAQVFNYDEWVTDDQIAAYAQGDFHLTHELTATLGERIAKVKSDLLVTVGPGVFDTGVPPVAASIQRETPSTPRAALSYQADPNNLFYISASKGFRIGGGNAPLGNICDFTPPATYKSDYVWSYEAGAKNTLFDGRMQLDSSVFWVNWSQIQQTLPLPCGNVYVTNTGSAVSKGFELALQALVTERLRVNLGVGYADAYFTSNFRDQLGNPAIVEGDKVGLLPQVNPPWNVNTSATYEIPLPQGEKIHLRIENQYESRNPGPFITQIPGSLSYYPLLPADQPIHLTNARVGYTKGPLDVAFFVDNVFNSHPLLGAYQDTPTENLITYSTLRPRTIGLSANLQF
jgi:iron complex outermembrane recepter protein